MTNVDELEPCKSEMPIAFVFQPIAIKDLKKRIIVEHMDTAVQTLADAFKHGILLQRTELPGAFSVRVVIESKSSRGAEEVGGDRDEIQSRKDKDPGEEPFVLRLLCTHDMEVMRHRAPFGTVTEPDTKW